MVDDKFLEATKKGKEQVIKSLYDKKREIKSKSKYSNQKSELDSMDALIYQQQQYWNNKIQGTENAKVHNIISAFANQIELYVDTMKVDLRHCYFYTHPNYNEQGLKCFFETDSISRGIHDLKIIKKIIYGNNDKIQNDSIILPIIKH